MKRGFLSDENPLIFELCFYQCLIRVNQWLKKYFAKNPKDD